jgi:hypothetical protein
MRRQEMKGYLNLVRKVLGFGNKGFGLLSGFVRNFENDCGILSRRALMPIWGIRFADFFRLSASS